MRFYITEQLSDNIAETPEGFLLCSNVPIARVGEYVYRPGEVPVTPDSSGNIRILRESLDVFDPEAVASFEGKPLTVDHPNDFVTPENWQSLAHGTVQNVRPGTGNQSDLLLADLLITTEKAIELVKAGLREISCGYDAQYEEIEAGLGKQHQIVGNHVALVSKGRAGKRCSIGDKTCDGCGHCKCNSNLEKEADMQLKDKIKGMKKWLDSFPFKDAEEETEEEKAEREKKDKETADKKAQDRGFKDAEEEAEFEEFKKKQSEDKKSKDAEEEEKKETEDDSEEEEKKEESEEEKQKATADCDSRWPEVAHRAEILFPGISIKKPTTDHASGLVAVQRIALQGASLREGHKTAVSTFTQGRSLDALTAPEVEMAFMGASELLINLNNSKVQMRDAKDAGKEAKTTKDSIANINAKNKAFYRKPGV